jgi:hypothetical protein
MHKFNRRALPVAAMGAAVFAVIVAGSLLRPTQASGAVEARSGAASAHCSRHLCESRTWLWRPAMGGARGR